ARSFGAFSFRPEDKEFYEAFNKALIEFKKTDDYKKILLTYGLSEESVEAARTVDTASLCNAKEAELLPVEPLTARRASSHLTRGTIICTGRNIFPPFSRERNLPPFLRSVRWLSAQYWHFPPELPVSRVGRSFPRLR